MWRQSHEDPAESGALPLRRWVVFFSILISLNLSYRSKSDFLEIGHSFPEKHWGMPRHPIESHRNRRDKKAKICPTSLFVRVCVCKIMERSVGLWPVGRAVSIIFKAHRASSEPIRLGTKTRSLSHFTARNSLAKRPMRRNNAINPAHLLEGRRGKKNNNETLHTHTHTHTNCWKWNHVESPFSFIEITSVEGNLLSDLKKRNNGIP